MADSIKDDKHTELAGQLEEELARKLAEKQRAAEEPAAEDDATSDEPEEKDAAPGKDREQLLKELEADLASQAAGKDEDPADDPRSALDRELEEALQERLKGAGSKTADDDRKAPAAEKDQEATKNGQSAASKTSGTAEKKSPGRGADSGDAAKNGKKGPRTKGKRAVKRKSASGTRAAAKGNGNGMAPTRAGNKKSTKKTRVQASRGIKPQTLSDEEMEEVKEGKARIDHRLKKMQLFLYALVTVATIVAGAILWIVLMKDEDKRKNTNRPSESARIIEAPDSSDDHETDSGEAPDVIEVTNMLTLKQEVDRLKANRQYQTAFDKITAYASDHADIDERIECDRMKNRIVEQYLDGNRASRAFKAIRKQAAECARDGSAEGLLEAIRRIDRLIQECPDERFAAEGIRSDYAADYHYKTGKTAPPPPP